MPNQIGMARSLDLALLTHW